MRTDHFPTRTTGVQPDHTSEHRLRLRVAAMLIERRTSLGTTRRALARAAGIDHRVLRRAEHARLAITPDVVATIAPIYGLEVEQLLPRRLPLEIRPHGVVATNGVAMSFTPGDETSLLAGYLRLIRSVRNQEKPPVIDLRRDDIEVLAAHLGWEGETVVARLGALMGVTNVQRRALVNEYATGAAVVSMGAAIEIAAASQHAAAAQTPVLPTRQPWSGADLAVPSFSWSPDGPAR